MMHTAELDSSVGSTLRSLTLGVMHTGELDLAVGCTQRSLTHCGVKFHSVHQTAESSASNISFFRFFVFVTSFNDTLQKTYEVKKVS